MKITVEMSLYPLDKEYKSHIKKFIKAMNSYEDLVIRTTAMSTYIVGEYKDVMGMLNVELEKVYTEIPASSTIIKLIPMDLNVNDGFLTI